MPAVQKQYIYGEKNKKIIHANILSKGKDGSTWHNSAPEKVALCKKGDFCFDGSTFDVHYCISGGNEKTANWEWVCNLNNLEQIAAFIARHQEEYEAILKSFTERAAEIESNVHANVEKILEYITASYAYKPWWFGTREEYNSMTVEQRNAYVLHFIEEGT